MKIGAEGGIGRDGLPDRLFFGAGPEVQSPHHFPAGGASEAAEVIEAGLVDDGGFALGLGSGNAVRDETGVIRDVAADANQAVGSEVAVKTDESRVGGGKVIGLRGGGGFVAETDEI